MYWRVNSIIFLLRSFGRSLSPYNKSSIKTSFERSLYPNDCTNSKTLARIFRRLISKAGQSNKKCSVVSIPSLLGHTGFMESLKLCLNL